MVLNEPSLLQLPLLLDEVLEFRPLQYESAEDATSPVDYGIG